MAEPIVNTLGIVGMKHCGAYDSSTNYEKLNVVTYQGSSYCAKGNTVGNLPTNTTYWDLLAKKGDNGDQGATGPQGPKPVKGVDYYTDEDKAELESFLSSDVTSEVTDQLGDLTSATPLAASSIAGMTDTTKIYVNTTDGHWYWYNGTSWRDGGVYQATEDSDSVDELLYKMDELRYDTNIFDKSNITAGYYLNPDSGNPHANSSYCYNNNIPVTPGKYIMPVYYGTFGSGAKYVYGYQSDDTAVKLTGIVSDDHKYVTIEIPNNIVRINANVKLSDLDTFMVIKGVTYPSKYIEYNKVILKENVELSNKIKTKNIDFISQDEIINIFNPDDEDIEEGKFIDASDGYIKTNANLNVSGFLPVKEGETYSFPVYTNHFGPNNANTNYVITFGIDKSYIRGVRGSLDNSFLTVTIPSGYGIKYIRVNFTNSNVNSSFIITACHSKDNFMVVNTDSYPKNKFYPYIANNYLSSDIHTLNEEQYNPLFNKSVVFLGDSICEANDKIGWAGRIGSKNNMLWSNKGIGGSTIAITSAGKTICTRELGIDDPDYIIMEGGTNDADRIGSIVSGNIPAAFGSYTMTNWGTNDSETYYGFDIETFCGAVEYMFKRFTTQYAGKKLGFIIAQKMGRTNSYQAIDNNRRAYFEVIMILCKKWGIPYLNLWDGCYLNPSNPEHYTSGEEKMYADGQHLTANGYDYISPIIESWMKTL